MDTPGKTSYTGIALGISVGLLGLAGLVWCTWSTWKHSGCEQRVGKTINVNRGLPGKKPKFIKEKSDLIELTKVSRKFICCLQPCFSYNRYYLAVYN